MPSELDSSRIERTKTELYAPEGEHVAGNFSRLTPNKDDIASDWGDDISVHGVASRSKGLRVLKWIVAGAAVIMLGSLGYLLYSIYDPFAKPSDKNIRFTLDLPVAIPSGAVADMRLTVSNDNKVALEYANLTIFYPQGAKQGDNPDRDFLKDQKSLGVIPAPGNATYESRFLVNGEENTDKEIRVVLEYRFKGISSIFTKEEKWPLRLMSAPVSVTVKALKEINPGQPVEFQITTVSNTLTPLRNALLKLEFPQTFIVEDADPKPTYGLNAWKLGDLDPSEKVVVRVRGTLSGEDTDEKVFKAIVGEASPREEREVGVIYSTTITPITVKRPFIGINLYFNGKKISDSASAFGQIINGEIEWTNNLDTRIANAQIEVKLRGTALDRLSVVPQDGGFYRSIDDTILWDERGADSLKLIEAKSKGRVAFRFSPLPSVTGNKPLKNPTIVADVTVRGKRVSETGVPEEVKSQTIKTVKITTDLRFSEQALYFAGPFKNRGPLPPQVEKETSYTIRWSIVNTSNDVKDVEVRGILPPYIKWAGSVSPGSEHVVYDKNSNQVIWTVGNIPAGTGVTTDARQLYFQVTLIPSVSQIGRSPSLLDNARASAVDMFTGESIERMVYEVSTNLFQSDSKVPRGSEWVIQ